MDRWIASLVAVSLVLLAAPAAAFGETTESQHEVEASLEDGELVISWETVSGEEGTERVNVPAGGPTAHSEVQVHTPSETEMVQWVNSADNPDDGASPPVAVIFEGSTSADQNPCIQIYTPQMPPIIIDPSCVPDFGWQDGS